MILKYSNVIVYSPTLSINQPNAMSLTLTSLTHGEVCYSYVSYLWTSVNPSSLCLPKGLIKWCIYCFKEVKWYWAPLQLINLIICYYLWPYWHGKRIIIDNALYLYSYAAIFVVLPLSIIYVLMALSTSWIFQVGSKG